MTETTTPVAHAADHAHVPQATPETTLHSAEAGSSGAATAGEGAHGMRPIALAFVVGNALVLGVFALVVATGHLDMGGVSEVFLTTATAAPTR